MIKDTFLAMGTTIEVIAESNDQVNETQALFGRYEARFSRFDGRSELTSINNDRSPSLEISPTMAEVLELAKKLERLTGGVFDPSMGSSVIAWGYDRTFEEMTAPIASPQIHPQDSWSIDGKQLHRSPGVLLDLGGLVKGWTADQAVETGLAKVVSAGGDIRSALPDSEVEIDDGVAGPGIVISLGTGGLATSSTMKRRWMVGARSAHHIVDPRTLAPADTPVLSATVTCRTAAEAEAAAKTLVILGVDGLAWADRQDWITAAMVTWHDGSVFATSGWELAA